MLATAEPEAGTKSLPPDLPSGVYEDWLYSLLEAQLKHDPPSVAVEKVFGYPAEVTERVWKKTNGGRYSPPQYAEQLVEFLKNHGRPLRRETQLHKLVPRWTELADQGDGRALLAIPEGRDAVWAIVTGAKGTRAKKVSSVTRSRKAVAAAKAVIAARLERSRNRQDASRASVWPLERYRLRLLKKLKARALEIAEDYHRNVRPLYKSKRAAIVYGRGGQEDSDKPYKGAYKGYTARWHNAGAYLDDEENPKYVVVENSAGKEVARIALDVSCSNS